MYKYVKRFLDITVSLIGLILLMPIFIILAIWIKLESAGPILFRAKRVGKNEKEFTMYKFRTMKVDSPLLPPNKLKDPYKYITKAGKILRESSLDELPQLFNILKGDMSFVGPRPGSAVNEEELRQYRRNNEVFSALPGVTGWAQVNGRDELAHNAKEKSNFDKYYVENISLKLDAICILRTLHVLRTKEGYLEGSMSDASCKNQGQQNIQRITMKKRINRKIKKDTEKATV